MNRTIDIGDMLDSYPISKEIKELALNGDFNPARLPSNLLNMIERFIYESADCIQGGSYPIKPTEERPNPYEDLVDQAWTDFHALLKNAQGFEDYCEDFCENYRKESRNEEYELTDADKEKLVIDWMHDIIASIDL